MWGGCIMQEIDLCACVNGDKAAWDALVERYAPVILAAVCRALRRHGDDPAVQDVVQEVFVRLVKDDYRLLRRFDPQRASLSTWLSIVARSTAISSTRARRVATVSLEEAAAAATPAPQPDLDVAEDASTLDRLDIPPDLLPERQRLILHLLFDREMQVEAAAQFMGVDPQTVRSGKHKALTKLRAYFARRPPAR